MLDFVDKKYGRVVIFEPLDVPRQNPYLPDELINKHYMNIPSPTVANANIVGYRSVLTREVTLFKNRFGPLGDYETEQFVLNYKVEEEIFDPILTRFEILDIR